MGRIVKDFFSKSDRVTESVITADYEFFKNDEKLEFLNQLPDYVLILNDARQIVYLNRSFLEFTGCNNSHDVIGSHPGEIFNCINACENGCGFSQFCIQCGAAHAIVNKFDENNKSYECCITSTGGKVHNLRVWARPYRIENEIYTILIIRNIEVEKSNSVLERILFHDVSNLASGVNGLLDMIDGSHENFQKYFWLLDMMSRELVDTIHNQQFLHQAEEGVFVPEMSLLNSNEIINEVIRFFEHHPLLIGKNITFKGSENITFNSDRRLLKYIIRVMVKNALEASSRGKEIIVNSKISGDKVLFQVHNHGYINSNVQLNIFKRSFSTKGTGHGWGAYGIKMLSEGYLNGKVWFSVSKKNGTTFFAEYPL
jgi:histidine kinase/DNA gyrase B/HSP90-like ATPase/PAS domain-containing protein